MAANNKQPSGHRVSLSILDELAARFLLPLPKEDRKDPVRVCFAVEQAHWFYQNHYLSMDNRVDCGTIKEFAAHLFGHVPFLKKFSDRNTVHEWVELWREYKLSVPTFGAIILNSKLDKVLIVQSYSSKATWGFPKGKVNQGEKPEDCAAREVFEEVGIRLENLIDKEKYLESVVNGQTIRLFIVAGVKEKTNFRPNCKGEIRDIQWFSLESLPESEDDEMRFEKLGIRLSKLFLVIPFVKSLKRWVQNEKLQDLKRFCQTHQEGKLNFETKLIEEDFMPDAWKDFCLNQEDVLMSAMGMPSGFTRNLRIR